MKHSTVDLDGPVHFADFGGEGPPLVLVHGLGGSHANWLAVAGRLSARFRVLAPDLVGFGRTPLAGRSAAVHANADLVGRFIDKVIGAPAIVVGNSMGGLCGVLLAASRPDIVSRLVLVNAALPRPLTAPVDRRVLTMFTIYMIPLAGTLFLRRYHAKVSPEQTVRDMLRLCGVRDGQVPPEVFEAQVAIARERLSMPWAHEALISAARSTVATLARPRRFEAVIRSIRAPTLIMQGTRDRLVPLAAAQAAAKVRSDWTFHVLDGVGHVPQIEVPDRWLSLVQGWIDGAPS